MRVQWFFPRRGKTLDDGKIEVYISGKTIPGSQVLIKGDSIATLSAKGKIRQLESKDAIKSPGQVDPQWLFHHQTPL